LEQTSNQSHFGKQKLPVKFRAENLLHCVAAAWFTVGAVKFVMWPLCSTLVNVKAVVVLFVEELPTLVTFWDAQVPEHDGCFAS